MVSLLQEWALMLEKENKDMDVKNCEKRRKEGEDAKHFCRFRFVDYDTV